MAATNGLTAAQVGRAPRRQGKVNTPPQSPTKTVGQIVRDNLCTYFNLVFVVLPPSCWGSVGSWLNMGFLGGGGLQQPSSALPSSCGPKDHR